MIISSDRPSPAEWQPDWSNCVVQKFGGTSIGKFPLNIVKNVIKPSISTAKVVVVVSARSSNVKAKGTTECLLRACSSALTPHSSDFKNVIFGIRAEHIQAAYANIRSPQLATRLIDEIYQDCSLTIKGLEVMQAFGEVVPEMFDAVVSIGERLSARFLSAILEDQGVSSECINLAEELDVSPEDKVDRRMYARIAATIALKVKSCDSTVPVVTGFFGNIPGGVLSQIGRGYTDLCASLLALGIGANKLQIWKEVEGFYTADPRRVPTAKLLSTISPLEASELTYNGSEIIHFLAVSQAMKAGIQIQVENVLNPRAAGSLVEPDTVSEPKSDESSESESDAENYRTAPFAHSPADQGPSAMTSKHNIVVVNVISEDHAFEPARLAKILAILGECPISIDVVSNSRAQLSVAVHQENPNLNQHTSGKDCSVLSENFIGAISQLKQLGHVKVLPEMAIISLVGKNMKNHSVVAGRIFSVLGDNNVNIEMIAQGASEICISCVVGEAQVDRAMNLLHAGLFVESGTL